MSDDLLAAIVGALVAGLGGLLVPALVGRVPEPKPKARDAEADADAEPEEAEPEEAEPEEAEPEDAEPEDAEPEDAEPEEPPKIPYAALAARPGLQGRSAVTAAVCGALVGWATGVDWPLVWLLPLVPVAIALSVIDWHTRLLPRVVVVPATLATILVMLVVGFAADERQALASAIVWMLLVRSFYWVMWRVLPGVGMGFGDVRLAALVGLVLGWVGGGVVLVGVWIGMVVFGLPGLVLAIVRRNWSLMKQAFPFGPFMLVGALLGLVWGTGIAERLWG